MADKDKQKAMAELWLSNLSQYPARVMFDDIPLEYRINAFIDGTMQLPKVPPHPLILDLECL